MINSGNFTLRRLSIGNQIACGIVIFLVPILFLGYLLVVEKDDLIGFTRTEIAGSRYLNAANGVLALLVAPGTDKATFGQAADRLGKAEAEDGGTTAVSEKSAALAATLRTIPTGEALDAAITQTVDLISSISDNSNITLDPDADTYFVGDIIVNQAPAIMQQTRSLVLAGAVLAADPKDDDKIAFAEARDGTIASAGALSADLAKALKGNIDGSLRANLDAPARRVSSAVDTLLAVAKSADHASLGSSAAAVLAATESLTRQADLDLQSLLAARIGGFQHAVITRLAVALFIVLLGAFVSMKIVRSITRPLGMITGQMKRLADGHLDIQVAALDRRDGIGDVARALDVFRERALEAVRLSAAKALDDEARAARVARLDALTAGFETTVGELVDSVSSAATELEATAHSMSGTAERASERSENVGSAAEKASANVATVAAAAEQLLSSISEIRRQVDASTKIAASAVANARDTDAVVRSLAAGAEKVGAIVNLISRIADQTNLLALNATIEAARAGAAGKGFAVVASEVKALASQTSTATEQITEQISQIQAVTQQAIAAISSIGATINGMSDITASICTAVDEQGAATSQIARNVLEASHGTNAVTDNIAAVKQAAHDTGSAAIQVLGAASELSRQSVGLNAEVGIFLAAVKRA